MTTGNRKANDETQISTLVRKYFSDFVSRDKKAVEEVLTDDFTFHSPHDPSLNKSGYFEKCWANGDNYRALKVEELFEKGDEAFVLYECETKSGTKTRTTEFFRIEGNKIKEIEVFYGSL